MQKNSLSSLALALVLAIPAHMALAQSTPASTPAKKALVARMIKLQRPGVEAMSRAMAEEPAAQMLERAAAVLPARIEPDKQEAVAKGIQADTKKYLDEAVPLVRDRALALAPETVGPLLDKNFSEAELSKLLSLLESPEYLKYQKMSGEMQAALQTQLVTDTRSGVEGKLKALEAAISARLGINAPAASAPAAAAPAAKPATK
ncbi:hypothetical protein [Hydrogenophaga sp. PAMC20947]|uniref:hypothetical protein n=1 Tax=Hydrogenophaga sp. PAMC20947 TaxID=2565558 RepID=UPI00109DB526|nr:hypothetical protein [Hydrogenophaga sp. PAMC20947]QCB48059.1 hypothetical protein E5678_19740 [Hydrogenophaga sp. PAMC20947]